MAQIHFNRIFIIESLQHGDSLTGTNIPYIYGLKEKYTL